MKKNKIFLIIIILICVSVLVVVLIKFIKKPTPPIPPPDPKIYTLFRFFTVKGTNVDPKDNPAFDLTHRDVLSKTAIKNEISEKLSILDDYTFVDIAKFENNNDQENLRNTQQYKNLEIHNIIDAQGNKQPARMLKITIKKKEPNVNRNKFMSILDPNVDPSPKNL